MILPNDPERASYTAGTIPCERLTLTIDIRPTYGDAATVCREVEESLLWLTEDHHAAVLHWGPLADNPEGQWYDEIDENGKALVYAPVV